MGFNLATLIPYEKREKIIAQALQEIVFARTYKQGKVTNWQKNENLYYAKKVQPDSSRSNVDLGAMQSFVHTILSKIDNSLTFKYVKRKMSQYQRVKRLNAVKDVEQQRDNWDIKDLVGKKQAVIYGRAIYSFIAESVRGFKTMLDNVDVYDFLIDPSAGGIDIERARYLGDYGVVLDKSDLKRGMKDGIYLKTETQRLIDNTGNATEATQEQTNKQNRTYDTNVFNAQKEISDPNKFKFWRWGTTYEGERYYLLLSETGATAIRVEKLEDIFESGMWWYWTWAAFPDLTEFWTPSYCDYVREVFMAQNVAINQALDNSEAVNKPQKVVNVSALEDLAELKYKKDGIIRTKNDIDANKVVQLLRVPAITTPLELYKILESIQEKASGVTAGAKGVSDEDKVGIYEGNQANAADRFGLLNKSYAFGYRRFAKLFEAAVREHLIKKVAVEMIGPDGVQLEEVSRRDIFVKDEEFGITVEASNAEVALSEVEKRTKIAFLSAQAANPVQNPKKAYEIQAQIAGFDDETIRQLQDTSEFGNADMMSEAERDIESLLDGKKIKPNEGANTAYKQRFVDYMSQNDEHLTPKQFRLLADYVVLLDPIITRNTVRLMNETIAKESLGSGALPGMDQEDPNATMVDKTVDVTKEELPPIIPQP